MVACSKAVEKLLLRRSRKYPLHRLAAGSGASGRNFRQPDEDGVKENYKSEQSKEPSEGKTFVVVVKAHRPEQLIALAQLAVLRVGYGGLNSTLETEGRQYRGSFIKNLRACSLRVAETRWV